METYEYKLLTDNEPTPKMDDELEKLTNKAKEEGYFVKGYDLQATQSGFKGLEQRLVMNKIKISNNDENKTEKEKETDTEIIEYPTLKLPIPIQYIGYFLQPTLIDIFNILIKADELCVMPHEYILVEALNKIENFMNNEKITKMYPLICDNLSLFNIRKFGLDWNMSTLDKQNMDKYFMKFIKTCEINNLGVSQYINMYTKLEDKAEKNNSAEIDLTKEEIITECDKLKTELDNKIDEELKLRVKINMMSYPLLFGHKHNFYEQPNVENIEIFTTNNIENMVSILYNISETYKTKNMPKNIFSKILNNLAILPQTCNLLINPKYRELLTIENKTLMYHHQLIGEEMCYNGINNWENYDVKLWTVNDLEYERNEWHEHNENLIYQYLTLIKMSDVNVIHKNFYKQIDDAQWCINQCVHEPNTKKKVPLYFNIHIPYYRYGGNTKTYLTTPQIHTHEETVNRLHIFTNNLLNFNNSKDNDNLHKKFYSNCVVTGSSFAYCVCCDIKYINAEEHREEYRKKTSTSTNNSENNISNSIEIFGLNNYETSDVDCPLAVGDGIKITHEEFQELVDEKVNILKTLHKNKYKFWTKIIGKRIQILNDGGLRTIDCYQVPFTKKTIWKHIAGYHLSCVRGYFDGYKWLIIPSAISAVLLRSSIDIRFVFGSKHPIELIEKYSERGFITHLNKLETNDFESYMKNKHKDLYVSRKPFVFDPLTNINVQLKNTTFYSEHLYNYSYNLCNIFKKYTKQNSNINDNIINNDINIAKLDMKDIMIDNIENNDETDDIIISKEMKEIKEIKENIYTENITNFTKKYPIYKYNFLWNSKHNSKFNITDEYLTKEKKKHNECIKSLETTTENEDNNLVFAYSDDDDNDINIDIDIDSDS